MRSNNFFMGYAKKDFLLLDQGQNKYFHPQVDLEQNYYQM